jgi:hypothetical protein
MECIREAVQTAVIGHRDPGEYWETVGRVEREGESGVGSYWEK